MQPKHRSKARTKVVPAGKTQEYFDNLADDCTMFVDRQGTVVAKDSTPVSAQLAMEYESEELSVVFNVSRYAQGNGSSYVRVKQKRQIVFEAAGSYTSCVWGVKVKKYDPGPWEEKIKPFAASEKR